MTSKMASDYESTLSSPDSLYAAASQFSTAIDKEPQTAIPIRLHQELVYFQDTKLSSDFLEKGHSLAKRNSTEIAEELIANGMLDCRHHYQDMAERLGVHYFESLNPENVIGSASVDVLLAHRGPLRVEDGGQAFIVLSPSVAEFYHIKQHLTHKPDLKHSFAIATPKAVRRTVWEINSETRVKNVVGALPAKHPAMSAHILLTGSQGFFIGLMVSGLIALAFSSGHLALKILHLFLSLIYLSFNLLKFAAGLFPSPSPALQFSQTHDDDLPIYTVLIALYKEANLAQQLVQAMSRLNWPKSKLDIKFICEADDIETVSALEAARPGPQFEIVIVPDYGPRTKPKALQYALCGARGDFISVYDAEDIPNPDQLLEAYHRFQTQDETVACLQAPLVISNIKRGWLPALFGLEYAGLFRRLIPLLAGYGLPIPLGGTSNHFRKTALLKVGGWDPCNVTEDADLGLRLYRQGYKTDVLRRPTLENAPEDKDIWIKQRTRWLKGWIQTWFVLMRNPSRTVQQSGLLAFIIMQILIVGMLIATIAHPLVYYFIFQALAQLYQHSNILNDVSLIGLFTIDLFNLIGGYLIFAFVGLKALIRLEKQDFKLRWLFYVPYYWLLMSFAGWRAITQLPKRAQIWEKTPHKAVLKR